MAGGEQFHLLLLLKCSTDNGSIMRKLPLYYVVEVLLKTVNRRYSLMAYTRVCIMVPSFGVLQEDCTASLRPPATSRQKSMIDD